MIIGLGIPAADAATNKAIACRIGGVFIPAIRFDETRFSPGPFDNPPFIGTMAELTWRFDFQGLSSRIRTAEDPPATKP